MNYVQIAIPFFILAILLEFLFGVLRKRQTYRLNDTVNSLQMGMLSGLVNVLRLGFSAVVFTWVVSQFGITQWSADYWWQWALAFVAYDLCYYWKHRYGHQWRIMWASHAAHHQSEEYNLSTALRQTGTDYIGFVFYLPMYLVGTPIEVIISVGSLNLVYQFWVHTEHVRRLGVLDYIFVTPSNHRVHHAKNPSYIDKNYGGVFVLWDRLFGTFEDEREDEPCRYGITHQLASWNPIWANAHVWWETLKLAVRTRRWQDKFLVWFKGPAWRPADLPAVANVDWREAKFDPIVSTFAKAYTFVQFWIITYASMLLQEVHGDLPRSLALSAFTLLVLSVFVQGYWLEGRKHAYAVESARLVVVLLITLAAPLLWPGFANVSELTLPLSAYVGAAGFALLAGRILSNSKNPLAQRA
jgi:sterol desaturase/sphingolipid hydroxylase (fatty acid hydroxylase superfamily)